MADQVVKLLVWDFAVGVGVGLLHELEPDLFADFFAVTQGVSKFAYFYLAAVILVENLEDFDYVGLADEEKSVCAVSEKLGEVDLAFS